MWIFFRLFSSKDKSLNSIDDRSSTFIFEKVSRSNYKLNFFHFEQGRTRDFHRSPENYGVIINDCLIAVGVGDVVVRQAL
jgi:hypothetical protein